MSLISSSLRNTNASSSKRTTTSQLLLLILCILFVDVMIAQAQTLNVQGVLRDNNMRAVPDGEYPITLVLYSEQAGGSVIYTENHSANVLNGVYSLELGSKAETTFRALDFSKPMWLAVQIDGSEVAERRRLSMSPYLFSPVGSTNQYPSAGDVRLGAHLRVPNSFKIMNQQNREILETGWQTGAIGDYTTLNSGWEWTGTEPVSAIVSERLGFSVTLGNDGNRWNRQLLRVTRAGNVGIGYTQFSDDIRSFLDVRGQGPNQGIRVGSYLEMNNTKEGNRPMISFNSVYAEGGGGSIPRYQPVWAPGTGMGMSADGGQGDIRFFGINWNNNSSARTLDQFGQAMRIGHNGRVGINTHNYSANNTLTVNGTAHVSSRLRVGGPNADPRAALDAHAGNRNNAAIVTEGRVGINTGTPTAALEVHGDVSMMRYLGRGSLHEYADGSHRVEGTDGFLVAFWHRGNYAWFRVRFRDPNGVWYTVADSETNVSGTTTVPIPKGQVYLVERGGSGTIGGGIHFVRLGR
ncbi:MAG: hypothetical protein LAT57_11900 [Balneolales bacterium]|nr:hypothetical protein [Balneolales bacterium]